MEKEFYFKHDKTTITISDEMLKIKRKGLSKKITHGLSGEKEININNITSVQVKKPTIFTKGYIQLAYTGSPETKNGILAAGLDENSVLFVHKDQEKIDEIKSYINSIIYRKKDNSSTNNLSVADEIKKLKELLDQDVLTQDEFDAKKTELLEL
ncbi:SHOCT domain-containing protein [Holzapfeliella sp. He02]|uniref:SHOCT domain-containing protein n=1 Tax=Holzapfeliella saturejae TaxID=3082953 RepID=A0ABU8SI16_9LACO